MIILFWLTSFGQRVLDIEKLLVVTENICGHFQSQICAV